MKQWKMRQRREKHQNERARAISVAHAVGIGFEKPAHMSADRFLEEAVGHLVALVKVDAIGERV